MSLRSSAPSGQEQDAFRALFVTGTDTGVGKSVIAASIARALRDTGIVPGVMKPYASGVEAGQDSDDIRLLAGAAGFKGELDALNPVRLIQPLAPVSAARVENRTLDTRSIENATHKCISQNAFSIIEGIGGVAVPITASYFVSDLIRALRIPALVVARSMLGTINHSLLTIEHLRSRDVPVAGIIFVHSQVGELDIAEQTGPQEIEQIANVKNYGIVPFVLELEEATPLERKIENLPVSCEAVQSLVGDILRRLEIRR